MLVKFYRPILALILTSFSLQINGQGLTIEYNNPQFIEVCNEGEFEVTLIAGTEPISNIKIEVWLPSGIKYQNGSVNNATEDDVSNLNRPLLSIPDLEAGEEYSFKIDGEVDCSIISDINSGKVFANTITAFFDSNMERVITLPYRVETGLLVITEIDPLESSGQFGDEVIRRITIKNTRLSSISSFNFTDRHDGEIIISTNGNAPQSSAKVYTATFEGVHFMTVGNNDDKLDFNEEYVIEEKITIRACDVALEQSNSYLTVDWGCNAETCQSTTRPASFVIDEFDRFSILNFDVDFELGKDFCIEGFYYKSLKVANDGSNTVEKLWVDFQEADPADASTIEFFVDGMLQTPDTIFLHEEFANNSTCSFSQTLHKVFSIFLGELQPGQEAEIKWKSFICKDACGGVIPTLTYKYKYDQFCLPENILDSYQTVSLGNDGALLKDSVSFYIGELVRDGNQYELRYDLFSDMLPDTTGLISVDFFLPCGFEWSNTPLSLSGENPINTTITNANGGQVVNLEYQLPFSSDSVWGNFYLDYVCDPICTGLDTARAAPLITSCDTISDLCSRQDILVNPAGGEPVVGVVPGALIMNLELQTRTQFIPQNGLESCNNNDCEEFRLTTICEAPAIIDPPIQSPGHLEFTADFKRKNFGYQDNNDDRILDNYGPPNLDLIRRDRVMTGDTATAFASGVVVTDIDGATFGRVRFESEFEAHTIDSGIDGGVSGLNDFDLFIRNKGIVPIEGRVRVKDADTGQSYSCDINSTNVVYDSVYKFLYVVNTKPEDIIDEWREMAYCFELNLENAHLLGCNFPEGFKLAEGDSVFFEEDFYIPYNPGFRVLNLRHVMRTGINDGPASPNYSISCGIKENFFQLSGYLIRRGLGNFDFDPCEPFSQQVGSNFNVSLGLPNFFPFEVRPIVKVIDWTLDLTGGFDLTETQIVNMGLDNEPAYISNQALTPVQSGSLYKFDMGQFQDPPYDEGFYFNLFHQFVPKPEVCTIQEPTDLSLYTKMEFYADFPENPVSPLDTLSSTLGFIPIIPELEVKANQPNTFSTNQKTDWNFTLENLRGTNGGKNIWMNLSSPSGLLSNLILQNGNGQNLSPNNGIYQLGDIGPEEVKNFQLFSDVVSCGLDSVQIIFGWNCDPLESINAFACLKDTAYFYVTAPLPQLEMIITSPADSVELCDVIPYHTIEVLNADLGTAYDLDLEILMPTGMTIMPGTSQMAYSSNSGNFQNIPDPTDLGNGNYAWNINDIQSLINSNGLPGVGDEPNNSFSIRFLGFANCGLIASAPPIVSITGLNGCDLPTNSLRKPGEKINVKGLIPSYETTIVPDRDPIVSCGDEFVLFLNVQASGNTEAGDSILVTLPEGVQYVPNSYQNIQNATTSQPLVQIRGVFTVLKWPIRSGLSAGTPIRFSFNSSGYGNGGCEDEVIQVQTIQSQEAFCKTNNEFCPVFVQSGSSSINVDIQYPEWNFGSFNASLASNGIDFEISGINIGAANNNSLTIDFYLDENGNGRVSSGDTFIGNKTVDGSAIQNGTFTLTGNLNVSENDICKVIAVFSANNECNCSTDLIRLSGQTILNATQQACSDEVLELGVSSSSGSNYFWDNPQNLSCTSCPMADFSAYNSSDSIQVFTYILTEEGGNCPKKYFFEVEVFPESQILTSDQRICAGDSVQLEITAGQNVTWSGAGILNPNIENPIVAPSTTTRYTVEINNGTCTFKDTVTVEVLPTPQADAGDDQSFCDEPNANVQLDAGFNPNYSYFWEPNHLLNDFLIHNPTIISNQSSEFVLRVTNRESGCTSTDVVRIEFEETPELVISDDVTICAGEFTPLSANGALEYTWTPFSTLDCPEPSCQTAIANPTSTTTYYVTGSSTEDCEAKDSVTVFVEGFIKEVFRDTSFCQGGSVEVFDQTFDTDTTVFEVFTSLVDGCDSTVTYTITEIPNFTEENRSICEGDSTLINGDYEKEPGTYPETIITDGCQTVNTVRLTVAPIPLYSADSLLVKIEIDSSQTIELDEGYTRYIWSDSTGISCDTCRRVTFSGNIDMVYTVRLYNDDDCFIDLRVNVKYFPTCNVENVLMPNIFSPNNDGRNDQFCRIGDGIEEISSIKIFNRWGQKIFEGSGPDAKWDGTFNGENQPPEVYVYIIEATCSDGPKVGDVTLMR